ncbi:Sec-independent protein translocase subunit TatA [Millisia brevis]|uniref:Sec-independent protein translocase subunit TatA n=1 Tax=Millisia brevis TaxID=264148 RepID=UPI0008367D0E|nr:Sec-independent protein translocase subunit TatA [Millisia brevis]
MGSLSPWHWAIVILAFIILFGYKRLPDAARGLGRSLRIFKSEVQDLRNDDRRDAPAADAPAAAPSTAIDPPRTAEAAPPNTSAVTSDPERRSA